MSESGKSCGDCGLCCKLLGIAEIRKEPGQWCGHFRKGVGGCGIYADRPQACRDFTCLWLSSERLDESWKPNRAKFVMFTDQDGRRLNIVVDPSEPLAWRKDAYYPRIKAMSSRTEEGHELVVAVGDRRFVIFPYEDIDLGIINPDHKIVTGFAMVEGQRTPYAMVVSDIEGDGGAP